MNDDLFKPIPQRGSRAETSENRRIYEIADELHRRRLLYEAQLRNGQDTLSHLFYDTAYRFYAFTGFGSKKRS